MLSAISWLRDYGTGATKPQLFLCQAEIGSERWVLKLRGNVAVELAADWIGCLLAHQLGIRAPEVAVADVDGDALSTAPAQIRAWAVPGPAFASRELKDAVGDFPDTQVIDNADPEFLGKLYALDSWMEVLDRRKPEGIWNLLLNTGTEVGELVVIDFGKCLAPVFSTVPVLDPEAVVVSGYPIRVLMEASKAAAIDTCDKIDALTDAALREMINSTPASWLSQDDKDKAHTFLVQRKAVARTICLTLNEV